MSISDKVAQRISIELKLVQDKQDIISYGAFAFMQIIISLVLVAIFGLLFGVLFQALTVSFVSSILRQYSGGVHASRPSICLIIGTFVTAGIAWLMSFISNYLNSITVLVIGLVSFTWSYYIIYNKAPVDSKAKPIKTEAKRIRMRKNSLIVLSIYLVIVLALMGIYYLTANKSFLMYSMCIYGAFSWQVFNLTIIGYKILNKIDALLCNLLF
jgi:accessory gene regulator B